MSKSEYAIKISLHDSLRKGSESEIKIPVTNLRMEYCHVSKR